MDLLPSYAQALGNRVAEAVTRLDRLDEYYRGTQPLQFLHPEIRAQVRGRLTSLVVNWPALIVDSIEDRLDVEGFRMPGADQGDDELWRIWQANGLDEGSQQCHLDSLIFGRSFALVWADEDDPETPRITVESAAHMSVEFDPVGNVVRAAKHWQAGDSSFLTVYGPDTIERYEAPGTSVAFDSTAWALREDPIENFMGVVPVVPFINRPRLSRPFGESEMARILPLTDAVNKLATDLMVSAEYHAMPRRWATGIDLGGSEEEAERTEAKIDERWTNAHKSKLWTTDSADAKFGQFPEASLDNFVSAINMLTSKIAALSGLPPHYFGQAGENPASADALRSSESSLVKRAQRKQRTLGGRWEEVMRLALLVRDGEVPDEARSMETIWASPETPTVAQKADAAVKLTQAGVITIDQALEDLGYTPEQRRRMREDRDRQALGAVGAQLDKAETLEATAGMTKPAALAAVGLLESARLQAGATSP